MDKLDLEVKITDKLTEIADLFRSKNGQYAEEEDAFVNFERAGELLGKTKEEALLGFVAKQMVHVCGNKPINSKAYTDHINDIIVYMLILSVMLEECKNE